MPKNPDGSFETLHRYPDDAAGQVPMTPERFQANLDDIVAYLSNTLTEDEINTVIELANNANIGLEIQGNEVKITSSNGDDIIPIATATTAGVLSKEDKASLDQIVAELAAVDLTDLADLAQAIADRVSPGDFGQADGSATLDENGKLDAGQIPDGVLIARGAWNAAINTPVLTDETGTYGDWYRVSVDGSTLLGGVDEWLSGDVVWRDQGAWRKLGSGGATSTGTDFVQRFTNDASVAGYAKTNIHGGALWRSHWTRDQRTIVFYGDQVAIKYDRAGDNWGPYVVAWDSVNNGNIVDMYAGSNYLLILTDQATGNLWHLGATENGQGGNGFDDVRISAEPERIAQFVTDAVKIVDVVVEANLNAAVEKFWFAITEDLELYGCGYNGAENVQGDGGITNVSVPKLVRWQDSTPLDGVASVHLSTALAPVWVKFNDGRAARWGAGTSGAAGWNTTSSIDYPELLKTAVGASEDRTDVVDIVSMGGGTGTAAAITWLLTSAGKIEAAGSRAYGNGDGLTGGDALALQEAVGAIDDETIVAIRGGGGSTPVCVAITDSGSAFIAGFTEDGLIGDGSTANSPTFTPLVSLPVGFDGAITNCRISAGYVLGAHYHLVYLEATIDDEVRLASIGYGGDYATATGLGNFIVADRIWREITGAYNGIVSWQTVGNTASTGLELVDRDARLWYAGANDQGQSGVQPGNLHQVATLQPCRLSGDRLSKAPSHRGEYDNDTTYSLLDEVEHNGSTWRYINLDMSAGNDPPNLPAESNDHWTMVAKGYPDTAGGTLGLVRAATGDTTAVHGEHVIAANADPATITLQSGLVWSVISRSNKSEGVVTVVSEDAPTVTVLGDATGIDINLAHGPVVIHLDPADSNNYIVASPFIASQMPYLGVKTVAELTALVSPSLSIDTRAFASDGTKVGEASGVGTGVPAYFDGTAFFRASDDTPLAA